MNNKNKYLISGVVVCSEYSNIWHLHLIIGDAKKFVLGDKNGFRGWKLCFHCKYKFALFYSGIK